jgi:hypothetical protein
MKVLILCENGEHCEKDWKKSSDNYKGSLKKSLDFEKYKFITVGSGNLISFQLTTPPLCTFD